MVNLFLSGNIKMPVPFPQTRYQGSKLKLLDRFLPIFQKIDFNTVLDAFGGTSAVSYMFKSMGKKEAK